ncbi:MAG: DUF1289 domain-containing protein [Burkholderiales bacterium]
MSLPPLPNEHSCVPSPCVGLCRMDAANRWCEGCRRSIDEIAGWGNMADREKLSVCTQLPQRRNDLPDPRTSPLADV